MDIFNGFGPPSNNMQVALEGQVPSSAPPTIGSMYVAFEDYDRQTRQRKYLISEQEDIIQNLEKELNEIQEKNKLLEADCEKLEMEAQAAESQYDKSLKVNALMQNEYQMLSKEMDDMVEGITKKQTRLQQIKLSHKELLAQVAKKEAEYLEIYMKTPEIATLMQNKKRNADLKIQLEVKRQRLEESTNELKTIRDRFDQGWGEFKQKCVTAAEQFVELRKMVKIRDELLSEYQKVALPTRRFQLGADRDGTANGSSASRFGDFSPARVIVTPRIRKPAVFKQMDRIFNQSSAGGLQITDQQADSTQAIGSSRRYEPMSLTPLRSKPSLVSQLLSRLKGTVVVNPMPSVPLFDDTLHSSSPAQSNSDRARSTSPVRSATPPPAKSPPRAKSPPHSGSPREKSPRLASPPRPSRPSPPPLSLPPPISSPPGDSNTNFFGGSFNFNEPETTQPGPSSSSGLNFFNDMFNSSGTENTQQHPMGKDFFTFF